MQRPEMHKPLAFVPTIHQQMQQLQFLLCYKGFFSKETTQALLGMTEARLESENAGISVKKKVFNVMVGCLQNICLGDPDTESKNDSAIFMLGKDQDHFFIFSGNIVIGRKAELLKEKLPIINKLESEELKNLFLSQIQEQENDESSESELAFIDLARKSGHKLEFELQEVDQNATFLLMKTSISRN
jgi:Family of unknown function (DUF6272)